MEIPANLWKHVQDEVRRVHHGRVIIELNKTSDKIDVVTESRERFMSEKPGVVNVAEK